MPFNQKELEIVKFGIANNKSRQEVEQAITNFRTGVVPEKAAPVVETKPSNYDVAMGQVKPDGTPNTEKGIIPQAVDQFKAGYSQVKEGVQKKGLLEGLQQIGRGTLNEMAAGIRTVFSPIEAGLKVVSQLPGFSHALDAVKKYVIEPASNENSVLTSKPVQDFMQSNPNASEVFGNLISIVGALVGGKKVPEIKAVAETAGDAAGQVVKDMAAAGGEKVKVVKDALGNTVDAAAEKFSNNPLVDMAGKTVRRVQDTMAVNAELKKQPAIIQKAVKADIPQPQAQLINDATTSEKAAMREMLSRQEKGIKELTMKPADRPDAVIGQEVMKTVKYLENVKKSAIIDEGQHVRNMTGSTVDITTPANEFMQRLDELGIKVGEKDKLDFSKSRFDEPNSTKDQKLVQLAYDKIKPALDGTPVPAEDAHVLRQLFFEATKNKNFAEPFNDVLVSLINNDQGSSLRSGILRSMRDQVQGSGPGYYATSQKNAIVQDALESFYKLIGGKEAPGKPLEIKNLTAGEVANRLEGNASAKIEEAFMKIEDAAKKYGYEGSDVSIRKLVAFKTILKEILGDTQHNSLGGTVERAAKAAIPEGGEVLVEGAKGNALGAAKAAIKFVKGNTKAEQARILKELLNGPDSKPPIPPGHPF